MSTFLELLVILFIATVAFTAGWFCRRADYIKGWNDGYNEERSFANARVIKARMETWRRCVQQTRRMNESLATLNSAAPAMQGTQISA